MLLVTFCFLKQVLDVTDMPSMSCQCLLSISNMVLQFTYVLSYWGWFMKTLCESYKVKVEWSLLWGLLLDRVGINCTVEHQLSSVWGLFVRYSILSAIVGIFRFGSLLSLHKSLLKLINLILIFYLFTLWIFEFKHLLFTLLLLGKLFHLLVYLLVHRLILFQFKGLHLS